MLEWQTDGMTHGITHGNNLHLTRFILRVSSHEFLTSFLRNLFLTRFSPKNAKSQSHKMSQNDHRCHKMSQISAQLALHFIVKITITCQTPSKTGTGHVLSLLKIIHAY